MRLLVVAAIAGSFAAEIGYAQAAPVQVELSAAREWLDDREDWSEATATVSRSQRGEFSWAVSGSRWSRFGAEDIGGAVDVFVPLGSSTVISANLQGAVDADFQPDFGVGLGIDQPFGDGWVAALRGSRRQYPVGDVTIGSAGLDRYAGLWRLGYTMTAANGAEDRWGVSHTGSVSYYPSDRSAFNLAATGGSEIETVGGGRALLLGSSSVDGWAVVAVGDRLQVVAGAGASDHETLGTRFRGRVGLRIAAR